MEDKQRMKFNFLILFMFLLMSSGCGTRKSVPLESQFKDPPSAFKPWLYWYWIDENISKDGITKDLEAMARAGIGQALIGHVSPGGQRGEVRILSDTWWNMVAHAVSEGGRLGIDIGFFNGPGWSQSGGPWISRDLSMRHIVNREYHVKGPAVVQKDLKDSDSLFQEIAIQALPLKNNKTGPELLSIKKVISKPVYEDVSYLFDGLDSTHFLFPDDISPGDKITIDLSLNKPSQVNSLIFDFLPVPFSAYIEIQAMNPDREFENIKSYTLDRRYINFEIGPMRFQPAAFSVPGTMSDTFRIQISFFEKSSGSGLREIGLRTIPCLDDFIEKQLGKMHSGPLPTWDAYLWKGQEEPQPDFIIDTEQIIDLTSSVNEDGILTWEVPEGDWIIIRSGMVPTGATNVPVPPEATGYECDKFTREAVRTHFDAFIGRFLKQVPPAQRKALKTIVIDSYEVGPQNWTDTFRELFQDRYGYDPVPWLPVFSGRIIESAEQSDRFLWDVRRLTADLISGVYVNHLRELCHESGLNLWLENYGHWGFPAEFLQYGGQADMISGEFWFENALWDLGPLECRAASSTAHIYGKKQVFAEAFTAGFNFRQYPAVMKPRGDQMFCEGINHMVQHVYIHQPDDSRIPGITAWFGMSYQRHNTWFEQSRAWNKYLARCHLMLQQGLPVTDIAYFIGEDAPKMTGITDPPLPPGYDYDFINADVIMNRLTVEQGRLILPDGKSYSLMVLPPLKTMRPEMLKKIRQLLLEGALIYGPPPQRSPSMENFPKADKEVRAIATELWGGNESPGTADRKVGKGHLWYGEELDNILKKSGIPPDVVTNDAHVLWTHRKTHDMDIYFISNQDSILKSVDLSFRISGKIPEFWKPDKGTIMKSALFRNEGNRTLVPVRLGPFESLFVVFREDAASPSVLAIKLDSSAKIRNYVENHAIHSYYVNEDSIRVHTATEGNYTMKLSDGNRLDFRIENIPDPIPLVGKWSVRFPENWDVPSDTVFDSLISWTEHPHPGIRHFSGTVWYRKNIRLPDDMPGPEREVFLELGDIRMIAEVLINDRKISILWKPPYTVNITEAIKPGDNEIQIGVTNTWWNRLVGDERYPEGFPGSHYMQSRTSTTTKAWNAGDSLQNSGLIGPVRIYTEKKVTLGI